MGQIKKFTDLSDIKRHIDDFICVVFDMNADLRITGLTCSISLKMDIPTTLFDGVREYLISLKNPAKKEGEIYFFILEGIQIHFDLYTYELINPSKRV